jgi:hypothetical protein
VVEGGPCSGDALLVGAPARPAGDLGEPDRQAEGDAVAGQLQDLIAYCCLADVPGAPRGIGPVLQLDRHADGQGAGVPRVGGREGHPGRVGAGEGAALEGLGDEATPVDHASANAPREKRADQGPPVAIVPDGQGTGEVSGMDHATAGPFWSSMPGIAGRSSSSRTSLRSFQPARMALSWAW